MLIFLHCELLKTLQIKTVSIRYFTQFPRVREGLRRVFLTQGLTWSYSQDGGEDCGQRNAWWCWRTFFPRMLPHCGWGLTFLLVIGRMPKFQIRWTSSQNCLSVLKMWQLTLPRRCDPRERQRESTRAHTHTHTQKATMPFTIWSWKPHCHFWHILLDRWESLTTAHLR